VAKFFPAWGGAVAALAIPRAEAGRKEEILFAAAVESIFAQVEYTVRIDKSRREGEPKFPAQRAAGAGLEVAQIARASRRRDSSAPWRAAV